MKTILVPIDFSKNSQKVLKAAKLISDETGAELAIMHTSKSADTGIAMPITESTLEMFNELENSYKQQLDEYVAGVQSGGYQAYGIWESDTVQTAILRQANQINADLIVVGRTGQGTFIDKLIGSSSAGVALEAQCPVLVIPPQATVKEFGHIIYATRFDPRETEILYQVKTLTEQLGAKLSLVNINPLHQLWSHTNEQQMLRTVQELEIADIEVVIVQDINFIEGISRYCYQEGADLLIVSTRQRGFLEQYITNPSITKRLIVETPLPLLVYHFR